MSDAHDLYVRGREKMAAGDMPGAIALLDESAGLWPHFKTLEVLGECLLAVGQSSRSAVALAAATALNEQSRAPGLLAEALARIGDNELAEKMAHVALSRGPGNRTALAVLERIGRGGGVGEEG